MTETPIFTSKIGDIQDLPRFPSIREASWMQVFVFLESMCGLSDSRTFYPQSRLPLCEKNEKKHEFFTFEPSLQEIQLKILTIRKLF